MKNCFTRNGMPMKAFILILPLLLALPAKAQVPQTLSYQGLLTKSDGTPVDNGTYNITFNFYTVPIVGSVVQSRTVNGVVTYQGLFSTIIGNTQGGSSNTPLNNLNPPLGSIQYYVGLQVNNGIELTPRVALTAVPYAFAASSLESTATVAGSQITGSITTATIPATQITGMLATAQHTDASITNAKLASGIDGSKITTGNIANTLLDASLQDLADGSLTGSKVGTGISASNVTIGTLPIAQLPNTTAGTTLDLSSGKNSIFLPSGTNTTPDRPTTPKEGMLRYNTTDHVMEYYNGADWYFVTPKVAIIKDSKTSGVKGGAYNTVSSWQVRELNTPDSNNDFLVQIASNQFTLTSGEYIIEASAPAWNVLSHRIKLKNLVLGNEVFGESSYTTQYAQTRSHLTTRITIDATPDNFEIQHFCTAQNTADSALGVPVAAIGANEIYTQVKITKLR